MTFTIEFHIHEISDAKSNLYVLFTKKEKKNKDTPDMDKESENATPTWFIIIVRLANK